MSTPASDLPRLFVWEDVLWDYSPGMIVVLAPDLETAIELVRHQEGEIYAAEMGRVKPVIIDLNIERPPPRAWVAYGGS